jgi:hypothetical protein
MTLSVVLLIVFAILLVALIAWASRPQKRQTQTGLNTLEALSQSRHSSQLPQILQILRPDDTEYLEQRGHAALARTMRQERRNVALQYLDGLEYEFATWLEISRVLAVMSPEVIGIQEFERWKLSVVFALNCAWLRWRLRVGLRPVEGFAMLSGMVTKLVMQLEAATSRVTEAVATATEQSANGGENGKDA